MSRLSDKQIDWALCDPEYGIGKSSPSKKNSSIKQNNGSRLSVKQSDYGQKQWDEVQPPKEYFDELKRVTAEQIIFGVNYFDYPLTGGRIVWDKLNGTADQFGCEIAYNSSNLRTDIVYCLWNGMIQNDGYAGFDVKRAIKQQGNKKLNEKRIHPTQKPISLYQFLISEYIGPNKIILDTGVGSGSIIVAFTRMIEYWRSQGIKCEKSKLICCEKDPDIYDRSIDFIQYYTKQNLFSIL